MNVRSSKRSILLILDIIAIVVSFVLSIIARFFIMSRTIRYEEIRSSYLIYFVLAIVVYSIIYYVSGRVDIVKMSYKEIVYHTIRQQVLFVVVYVFAFFVYKQSLAISRLVVALFVVGNVMICVLFRIGYHKYCVSKKVNQPINDIDISNYGVKENKKNEIQHCYIVGAKSIGQYGGYESFLMNLLIHQKDNRSIKYHVACKANGQGCMDIDSLPGATRVNDREFTYCNAHCFLIDVPDSMGSAQAISYDIDALKYVCDHIEWNHIQNPIVYILASRVGPFERKYVKRIHAAGGRVFQNPDGHEDWRRKWNLLIRKYWKLSEKYAVKNADLVICDSVNIEKYIKEEYSQYCPRTEYIAYGSYVKPSNLSDDDPKYVNWLLNHNLKDRNFYISVGRFVPENNFDVMVREFMISNTDKDFAIITTENSKYADELQQKYHYRSDKRIKFVGTVYDAELLTKIRENACGYLHGHEVGGTNPSLLESLGITNLNLLYDVGFNREVAENTALYWTKEEGNLSGLINRVERMSDADRDAIGAKAKARIRQSYSWEYICGRYEEVLKG